MVFDLMGGKKIDLGLPSFNDMMKGKGKGITLLPSKFDKKNLNQNNLGIKPINLGSNFSVNTKRKAPAKTSSNDIIGIGDNLKKPTKLISKNAGFQNVTLRPNRLSLNPNATAEQIRKDAFDQQAAIRGAGLEEVGTAQGVRTDAEKFAFGIQNRPTRDQSVISNRKFQFVTLQGGVLQKKQFGDKKLAEAQRRLLDSTGAFESVSKVREVF